MAMRIQRMGVNLSAYPDLVVIYLGMRVRNLQGLKTLASFGPQISAAVEEKPEGLLLHESLLYSLFRCTGMRQYWRDFRSSKTGHDLCHIKSGGPASCEIMAARDSGTRLTSCGVERRPSTTTLISYLNSLPSCLPSPRRVRRSTPSPVEEEAS
jgi:hypothetical protein